MIFNSNFLYVLSRQPDRFNENKNVNYTIIAFEFNTNIPKKYPIHYDAYSLTQDRNLISEYLFFIEPD